MIHRDESITHAPRQIFMLIRYAMERDRTHVVFIRSWKGARNNNERNKTEEERGRRGGRGPNDGTVINHAGQQSNVCKYNQTM